MTSPGGLPRARRDVPFVRRCVVGVYELGLMGFFALTLPYFLFKDRHTGKYRATFAQRLGRLPAGLPATDGQSIWVHAVSVGEVLAARPLVAALRGRYPERRIYLTTTTLTGQTVAQQTIKGADGLCFMPFDFRWPVARALDRLQPALLVLVETELWPNLIHAAVRRGTRVAVVNGRLSSGSFANYRRVRGLLRHVLAEIDCFLMQSEPHAERLRALGAPAERIEVSGNLKFDALDAPEAGPELRALFACAPGVGPLIVAGSTVEGEEAAVLKAFQVVRARYAGARLVLVPRHPERVARVLPLVAEQGLTALRRSALTPGSWRDEVVLVDTLGELARLYALADLAFVGGSLVPSGGHNVLEPAACGRPIVVGPHMQNFQEIADAFLAEGALVQVRTAEELGPAWLALLDDPLRCVELGLRGRSLVLRNRGALDRTVGALAELLA